MAGLSGLDRTADTNAITAGSPWCAAHVAARHLSRLAIPLLVAYVSLSGVLYTAGALAAGRLAASSDFPNFYTGGAILLAGQGERLYDFDLQWEVQQRAIRAIGADRPPAGGLLTYIVPPFAALLFAPLALLPLDAAFLVWVGMSAACGLAAVQVAIRSERWPAGRRWLAAGLALVFFPMVAALVAGLIALDAAKPIHEGLRDQGWSRVFLRSRSRSSSTMKSSSKGSSVLSNLSRSRSLKPK